MTQIVAIEKILFMDIETAPAYERLDAVPEPLQTYWRDRYEKDWQKKSPDFSSEDNFLDKAGIHALYARVVCISMGFFSNKNTTAWRQISLYHLEEKQLLTKFIERWNDFATHAQKNGSEKDHAAYAVCGHNIMNFDLPFLGRRMLMHQMKLPDFWYEAQWKKDWNLKKPAIIDTMNLWGFTSRENQYIPLTILAQALGMSFTKSMSHDGIREAFWAWKNTGDISHFLPVVQYCEKDVRTNAEIYIRMQLPPEQQEKYLQALQLYETQNPSIV